MVEYKNNKINAIKSKMINNIYKYDTIKEGKKGQLNTNKKNVYITYNVKFKVENI